MKKTQLKKLSFFDIVILGLLLILGGVFFLFFYRKSDYINIRVKVTDQDVLYEYVRPNSQYANHFVVGDTELDSLGRMISEISNIESFPVGNNKNILYVDLLVKATYDTRTKLHFSRGQKIVYGAPVRFSLSKVTFDGYIVDFPGKELGNTVIDRKVTIKLKSRFVEKEIADSMKLNKSVKNSRGEAILSIEGVAIQPSEMVTQDSAGYTYLRYHPFMKDLIVTIEAKVTQVGETIYLFDDIPLLIGSDHDIFIEDVMISGAKIFSIDYLD